MAGPGDLVGEKYRLVKLLDEGGMATVWEAEHLVLETRVAVKLLAFAGDWADGGRERFLEEARTAAGVKHRNVVQTLDFGATDAGTPFIVTELLSRESLADRVRAEAPMPPAVALPLIDQVLAALGAVHQQGIVHRDLKPENVLFSRDTDGSYPKLIDFGISKSPRSRRGATRPGMVLGTPEFMSPEQASGAATIDHRTDLYSAGVVLYEMLSGAVPYEAEQTSQLLAQVIAGGAPSLLERGAAVSPALSDAVARAMAVDPRDRYADAAQMRAALASAGGLARASTPSAPPSVPPPASANRPSTRPRLALPDLAAEVTTPRGAGAWLLAGLAGLLLVGIPVALYLRGAPAAGEAPAVAADPAATAAVAAAPPTPPLRSADDHTIYVHLADFPEDGTLYLDGEPFSDADLEQLRRGDVVEVPVPRRRGRPFTLRIERPGYEDWRMRRWTVRDFEARVVQVPILE